VLEGGWVGVVRCQTDVDAILLKAKVNMSSLGGVIVDKQD